MDIFLDYLMIIQNFSSESGLDEGLLGDLNAWDVKWIDQPDFNRRLNAFKKLEEMANEKNISVNLGIIVIYTCFFFVKTVSSVRLFFS